VAAVAAVDVVLHAQAERLPDGLRLLTQREVRGAAVVVLDALVVAAELDLVEHVLEEAKNRHVPEDAEEVLAREAAGLQLILHRAVVLVHGDRLEGDGPLLAHVLRENHLTLGHRLLLCSD
jgi:hypothetical protein